MPGLAFLTCTLLAIAGGDTVSVRCPDRPRPFTLQIAEIAAPDLAQPYGKQSLLALRSLCTVGQPIGVYEYDYDERTRHGHAELLCVSTRVSEYMIEQGAAWVAPEYLRQGSKLPQLQLTARAEKMGLWALPAPVPPWIWRKPCTCT